MDEKDILDTMFATHKLLLDQVVELCQEMEQLNKRMKERLIKGEEMSK